MEAVKRQKDLSEIPSLSLILPMTPTMLRIFRQLLPQSWKHNTVTSKGPHPKCHVPLTLQAELVTGYIFLHVTQQTDTLKS